MVCNCGNDSFSESVRTDAALFLGSQPSVLLRRTALSLRVQPRDGPSLELARYLYRSLFWAVCQFVPLADDDDPFAWRLAVTPSGLDLTLKVVFGLERDKDMKMAPLPVALVPCSAQCAN